MSTFGDIAPTVHRRRPRSSVALVGVPVLAAILGALLALAFGEGSGAPPPRAAAAPSGAALAAGDLRVTLPHGWTQSRKAAEPVPGFEGARAIHARAGHAELTIALLPARRASLLPWGLGAAPSRPSIVRAGAIRAYHYALPATGRGSREIVVAPTSQGVATIACSAAAAGACDRVLHGLRLATGAFVALDANAAFLAHLPAATRTLDAQHLRTRERLASTTDPEEAAGAAARLAAAYEATARTLRRLAAARGGRAAATVDLLDRLRSDYARLALVVRRGDRAAFKAAAAAIDAGEARLAARLQAWQRVLAAPAAR
jgi:hypothetical protein